MVARELERAVAPDGSTVPEPPRQTVKLSLGTRLIREWNGKTIAVEVQAHGYIWEDRTYRSLSLIAREVTGAHWSVPRFFGLNGRG